MTVGVPVDESSGVNICLCHLVKTVDQTVNTSLINTSQRHLGYWTCLKPNNTTTVLVKILPGGLVIDCTPSKTPQGCSFIKKYSLCGNRGGVRHQQSEYSLKEDNTTTSSVSTSSGWTEALVFRLFLAHHTSESAKGWWPTDYSFHRALVFFK